MSDLRWAARYAFVDELWRDRTRIVVDAGLERCLERRTGLEEPIDALLDDLLPARSSPQAQVWMAVQSDALARRLGAWRPGTNFVTLDRLAELISNVRWQVLLLDASALGANDGPDALASRLSALRVGARSHAAVVLSAPAREEGQAGGGLDYAELSDIVAGIGGGRVFGLYTPPMAAVVDFGERVEAAVMDLASGFPESFDDAETVQFSLAAMRRLTAVGGDDADEEEEDVPLTFDNTLGSQEPALAELVAVVGDVEVTEPLPGGLTLVELPADTTAGEGVRAQLTQARRQLERLELQQQAQLERAERLVRENEVLAERYAAIEAMRGAPLSSAEGAKEELEAALAREQALRWRVGQLEHQVAQLVARPVDALEAEVAALRAALSGARLPITDPPSAEVSANATETGTSAPEPDFASRGRAWVSGASGSRTNLAAIRAVEGLVRRIERGGIGTLQLRRELVELRRRLQA